MLIIDCRELLHSGYRFRSEAVGELTTVKDLIVGKRKPSEGFTMLIERQMPELTFEAIALRYPHRFDQVALDAASERLDTVIATEAH